MNLTDIKEKIKEDLYFFNENFKKNLKTNLPLLEIIIQYLLDRSGKQIRPILVILSARIFENNSKNEAIYEAAAAIEYIHNATLIHDDVVDEAEKRRGIFTLNQKWNNKIAVLTGDFLLSKALIVLIEKRHFEILKYLSIVVKQMSEGEILQLQTAGLGNFSLERYLEIIQKKTAVLLAACCAAGAKTAEQSEEICQKLWDFGENLGMAFQIQDDLLDAMEGTGKKAFNDLSQKKATLPLLMIWKKISFWEKINLRLKLRKNKKTAADFQFFVNFIQAKNGFELAEKKRDDFLQKAIAHLDFLPNTKAKKELLDLAYFMIHRSF